MGTLGSKVDELSVQDDLKCSVIGEIAVKLDIEYRQAEKMVNKHHERAMKLLGIGW